MHRSSQGNKLVGTGSAASSYFGSALAFSDDTNTLAIGGTQDNAFVGATWIFVRNSADPNGWTQQGSKLVRL